MTRRRYMDNGGDVIINDVIFCSYEYNMFDVKLYGKYADVLQYDKDFTVYIDTSGGSCYEWDSTNRKMIIYPRSLSGDKTIELIITSNITNNKYVFKIGLRGSKGQRNVAALVKMIEITDM